ncbi:MAG TPA: hypothetical protein VHZ97_03550 [Pseudonocardiaceae bacterium]|nr:hypothetical protein [Pseudonocardiaceae bacterium]
MQPGPPYPPQQPGYPGNQPPYPQQPYPGYPQGYQQPFPGPPGPRKPKAGIVVLIVALALVVVGGGTTALVLLTKAKHDNTTQVVATPTTSSPATPTTSTVLRYQHMPPCGQLNSAPFSFTKPQQAVNQDDTSGLCDGGLAGQSGAEVSVQMQIFNGPNGVDGAAQWAKEMSGGGQQVSGTGFENAPYVTFPAVCEISYTRSNEYVLLEFEPLPGVTDLASCRTVGMTYAQQLYKLIG